MRHGSQPGFRSRWPDRRRKGSAAVPGHLPGKQLELHRQVRGRGCDSAELRDHQGGRQEHPHRRQLHRAGDAAVRRHFQHLHRARPGYDQQCQPMFRHRWWVYESNHGSGPDFQRWRVWAWRTHCDAGALRRPDANRPRLHEHLAGRRRSGAIRRCYTALVRPQGGRAQRPDGVNR